MGLSSGFGGSDDEDDCNSIAFGGSQLVHRQLETRMSAELPLSTGGIRYRATDPRHATATVAADSAAVTEAHTERERKHGKQKKEKRKKEKRKKEKKERKERKRNRKKERIEEQARKKRRRDSDDSDSTN